MCTYEMKVVFVPTLSMTGLGRYWYLADEVKSRPCKVRVTGPDRTASTGDVRH